MTCGSLWRSALVVAALASAGCGDGGDPDFYPQIQFRLVALGGDACFSFDHVSSSRARHELEPGSEFKLADGEQASFLLANAPPPYEAQFAWVECPGNSGEIRVFGFEVQGPVAAAQTLNATTPTVVVRLRQDVDDPISLEIDSPRARFNVCAPLTEDDDCSNGIAGRVVTGSITDAFTSHDLRRLEGDDSLSTPAVLFLEHPRDQVRAVFRGEDDQLVRGELFVDDDLKDSDSSKGGDVVLSEDL